MGFATQTQAAAVHFLKSGIGISGQQAQTFGFIDSSNTTMPRIESAIQRGASSDICDIQGKMYDTNSETISVDGIDYSTVGPDGPWTAGTILWSDPLFIWNSSGSPTGDAFFIPVSFFPGPISGTCWVRMRVSWP